MGSGGTRLGFYDVPGVGCNHCGVNSLHRVTVFGKYFRFKFIPFFPTGITMTAECENCNKTIPQTEFPAILNQQYQPNKSKLKRPWWHFFGVGAIALVFLFNTLISITDTLDPRSELLKNDLALMSANPPESDSISNKLSLMMTVATMGDELDEKKFKYRTVVKDDNALLLASIPELSGYDDESRESMIEVMEMVAEEQADLKGKNIYYGIQGKSDFIAVKTPRRKYIDDHIASRKLYPFYGKKEEVSSK